jgi:hypothetical protein
MIAGPYAGFYRPGSICATPVAVCDNPVVLSGETALSKGAVMDENADRRIRAYSTLEGLRQSLPMAAHQEGSSKGRVMEPSINLYESALDDLAACGENIDQYRLPRNRDESQRDVMLAVDLQGSVLSVFGYFTVRDAVLNQAKETGATLERLIGFEAPQGRNRSAG